MILMRNNYLLIFGALLCALTSCVGNDDDGLNHGKTLDIKKIYQEQYAKINEDLSKEVHTVSFPQMRAGESTSLMEVILSMPISELEAYVLQNEKNGTYAKLDARSDSIQTEFFAHFSANDFYIIDNVFSDYVKNGGHDQGLVCELISEVPSKLLYGCVYVCAYADNLASKDLWNWSSGTTNVRPAYVVPGGGGSERERECKEAFWNKLRLLALQSADEYLIGMITGVACPEVDILVTASNLLDGGFSAMQYYECLRHSGPILF